MLAHIYVYMCACMCAPDLYLFILYLSLVSIRVLHRSECILTKPENSIQSEPNKIIFINLNLTKYLSQNQT